MSDNRHILSILAIVALVPAVWAPGAPPPAAPPMPPPPPATTELRQLSDEEEAPADLRYPSAEPTGQAATALAEAARRSVRNPFWPIGYKPPVQVDEDTKRRMRLQAQAAWPKLEYTPPTRLPSGPYVAIVKGIGLVESDDVIRVVRGKVLYRWRVRSIDAEGLHAERLPLRAVRP